MLLRLFFVNFMKISPPLPFFSDFPPEEGEKSSETITLEDPRVSRDHASESSSPLRSGSRD
jgi:hypothetical protein